MRNLLGLAIWLFTFALFAGAAHAQAPSMDRLTCAALLEQDFTSIQDAPAKILEAGYISQNGSRPDICRIRGYIASQIQFDIRLPKTWNQKFIELGCGGYCGIPITDDNSQCDRVLAKGYACIITNMGHRGEEALWAFDNLAGQIDHGSRAAHVTALAGKAITERFYGSAPQHSYFMGCSTGGREALMEAQRFPWDFEGIIAGAPALNPVQNQMAGTWTLRAIADPTGKLLLTGDDLRFVHATVTARCDMDDGVRDGLFGAPATCGFRPEDLSCTSRKEGRCLSPEQVAALRKIYAGPTTSNGLSVGHAILPGTELTLDLDGGRYRQLLDITETEFKFMAFHPAPGPTWKLADFDFDRDYRRFGVDETLIAADNPDLSHFKAAGGKLISYVGLEDPGQTTLDIDYFEKVQRTMGGSKDANTFVRFFTLPGVQHCAGGEGADVVDYLGALEGWVEHSVAPDRLIASHLKESVRGAVRYQPVFPLNPADVQFTRPLYPYPLRAHYRGKGNPDDASSFEPISSQ